MFDNLVASEPKDVEAYLRTTKGVISLCDHIGATDEVSHRMNSCTCWWMKHQFPDAGWPIRDLQIVLRVGGTDVGKRTEISRFQTLQNGGNPVDLLSRGQLGSESGPTRNRKHRQSAYRETLLHCQSSSGVAYKPVDAAAQGRMHNYEPVSSLFSVSEPAWFDIANFSFQARRVHRLFTCRSRRKSFPEHGQSLFDCWRTPWDLTWSGRRRTWLSCSSCARILRRPLRGDTFRSSGAHPSFPRTVRCPASRWGFRPPSP